MTEEEERELDKLLTLELADALPEDWRRRLDQLKNLYLDTHQDRWWFHNPAN